MGKDNSWSQVVFFPRASGEIEALVEGYIDDEKGIVISSVSDMNADEDDNVKLSHDEMQTVKDCLYDSMFNYTGPGKKFGAR